jgi:hypothetical protein
MGTMQAFVETLKVSRKQNHRNLTVIPLLASDHGDPDYLTLEEGLSQGFVVITEISTGGTFLSSNLKFPNMGRAKAPSAPRQEGLFSRHYALCSMLSLWPEGQTG